MLDSLGLSDLLFVYREFNCNSLLSFSGNFIEFSFLKMGKVEEEVDFEEFRGVSQSVSPSSSTEVQTKTVRVKSSAEELDYGTYSQIGSRLFPLFDYSGSYIKIGLCLRYGTARHGFPHVAEGGQGQCKLVSVCRRVPQHVAEGTNKGNSALYVPNEKHVVFIALLATNRTALVQ